MQYDIFLSYSHHDNTARGNWIEQFHQKLADDFRCRSGRKLNIFFDREDLGTGDALPERLRTALRQSRIFMPVLSPAYLSSPWCRREFLHFLEHAGDLILDGSSRILPLQFMPYDRFDPEDDNAGREAGRIATFLADNGILYADFYHPPLPLRPNDPAFDEKIAALSIDVFDLLRALRQNLDNQQRPEAPAADAIFLGYTASGSKLLRDSLLRELQKQREYGKINYRILPDEAPDAPDDPKNLPAAELEDFLRRQLQTSIFSIHLFDDLEGPKPAGSREPIPHLQYRLAKETAATRPDFRLFIGKSATEECPVSQEEFFQGLSADARALHQIEGLPTFESKAIKDFILDKIRLRETAPPPEAPAGAPRRVFFIHSYPDKDDPLRTRLDDLIYAQQFDVYVPVFHDDDPYVDPESCFRDFWLVCSKAIVLLRSASTAWCNAIKVDLIKTAADKQPPFDMAICVAEPEAARRIREVRSHEFQVIDCAQEGFEQQVIRFLNNQRHA